VRGVERCTDERAGRRGEARWAEGIVGGGMLAVVVMAIVIVALDRGLA